MPDVHLGIGATVGSVIPTRRRIIPAAVGVDIGCGMMAVRTDRSRAASCRTTCSALRTAIEARRAARPHRQRRPQRSRRVARAAGRERRGVGDARADGYTRDRRRSTRELGRGNDVNHLGTLGTGNHFIEVCLDEAEHVWFMLHSGSRGVGNRIGQYFIELAKQDMRKLIDRTCRTRTSRTCPRAPSTSTTTWRRSSWAQTYAMTNRELMMDASRSTRCATRAAAAVRARTRRR